MRVPSPPAPFVCVMYHYVRPIARGRYGGIKGLEAEDFRSQIQHLKRHHTVVPMDAVVEAVGGGEPLPRDACALTFDDGYADHYRYAHPIMASEGVTGAFYAPRSVLEERRVLEVNKVHFILALSEDADALERRVDAEIERERLALADPAPTTIEAALPTLRKLPGLMREAEDLERRVDAEIERERRARPGELARLPGVDALKAELRHPGRFDPAGVIYIKRVLQHALPDAVRARIADRLFAAIVSEDEAAFAEELYLSLDQARVMRDGGAHFGGHGDRHLWHSTLNEAGQRAEIDGADRLLDRIGVPRAGRTYCYPYGDHDALTRRLLAGHGYALAFTSATGRSDPAREDRFGLSRLDTNDLPLAADAPPGPWSRPATGPSGGKNAGENTGKDAGVAAHG